MPLLTVADLNVSFQRALVIASALAIVGIAAFRYGPGVYATLSGQQLGGGVANSGHLIRQPVALSNGLVGWWRLDGDAKDSSGNGKDGSLNNFVSNGWTSGKFGGALAFDGTDDFVSAGSTGDFNMDNAFTVSLWFNKNSTLVRTALGKYLDGADQRLGYKLMIGGNVQFTLWNTRSPYAIQSAASTVSANGWYHVAFTEASGTTGTLYLNGVAVASGAMPQATDTTTTPLYIGQSDSLSYFDGIIDDVRIYNRALSASEVQQLYAGSPPVNCDQYCQGWWKLDETGGSTARDATLKNANNLTDHGTVTQVAGRVGSAAHFAAASSQYLDIATNVSLNGSSSNLSFSAWVYRDSTGSTQVLLDKWQDANNHYKLYLDASDIPHFEAYTNATKRLEVIGTTPLSSTATWYHLAVVIDRATAANCKLYLNGSNDTAGTPTTSSVTVDNTGRFELGRAGDGTAYFDGRLDEVALWQRTLASAEVTSLYNAGSGKSYGALSSTEKQGLVSWWGLDEASGISRADGQGGVGVLTNFGFSSTDGWTSGVFSNSLTFDGTDDYIDLGSPIFSTSNGLQPYSATAWIRHSTSNSTGEAVVAQYKPGDAMRADPLYIDNVQLNKLCYWKSGNCLPGAISTTLLNDGQWHFVAFTKENTGKVKVYVDGRQEGTGGTDATVYDNTDATISFSANHFSGSMDDVRIYTRALADYEVYDQYLSGRSGL